MNEVWLPVPGYYTNSGYSYLVSDTGRVMTTEGNMMKGSLRPDGYQGIALRRGNEMDVLLLHRLVATVFIPKYSKGLVDHRDYDKQNNYVDNLRWITQRENVLHSLKRKKK